MSDNADIAAIAMSDPDLKSAETGKMLKVSG
jgi:hypothetical protein